MNIEETIENWKETIYAGIRHNLAKYGNLAPAIVILHRTDDKINSIPYQITFTSQDAVRPMLQELVSHHNAIAYIAFSEAKIHITSPLDQEKSLELYKSVGYDLSKLKDSRDSVVIVEETLFTSETYVYEIVKGEDSSVMSPEPMRDIVGTGHFGLFAGFLKI